MFSYEFYDNGAKTTAGALAGTSALTVASTLGMAGNLALDPHMGDLLDALEWGKWAIGSGTVSMIVLGLLLGFVHMREKAQPK